MATIATLSVSVTARTSKFEKGLKRAIRKMDRFSAKMTRFGGLVGGVVVAGLGLFVKRTLDSIDATAKLAARIGTTTEDLQKLRFAAQITGADAQTLDKSFEQLSKRLGEASQNLGTGKDGLKALGLELEALIGRNPAEQFRIIAEEISKLGTQEEKVAVATQLFGRAGTKLVNTLALGEEGLAALGKQADALGISFNAIEAKGIEDANDAITRLQASFQGAINQLTIKLAPTIQKVANLMTGFSLKIKSLDKSVIQQLKSFGSFILKLGAVLIILPKVISLIAKLVLAFKSLAKAGLLAKVIAGGPIAIIGLTTAIGALAVGAKAIDDAFSDVTGSIGSTIAEAQKLGNANEALGISQTKLTKNTEQLTAKIMQETSALKTLEKQVKANALTDEQRFQTRIAQLETLLAKGRITKKEFSLAFSDAADTIIKIPEALKKMRDQANQFFEEAKTPIEKFDDKIKELKKSFDEGFITEETRDILVDRLTDAFKGVLENSKELEISAGFVTDEYRKMVGELTKASDLQRGFSKTVVQTVTGQELLNNLYKKAKIPKVSAARFAEINTSLITIGKGFTTTTKKQKVEDEATKELVKINTETNEILKNVGARASA